MKIRQIFAVILCLACLFSVGCNKKETMQELKLNEVTRSVFYAPLYAAVSKGFFVSP